MPVVKSMLLEQTVFWHFLWKSQISLRMAWQQLFLHIMLG